MKISRLTVLLLFLTMQLAGAEIPIRVAIYKDAGADDHWGIPTKRIIAADPAFTVTEVSAAAIRNGILEKMNVVVFPGGRSSLQSRTLEPAGQAKLKEFLANGGGYVGFCAGAYLATTNSPGALSLINAKVKSQKWDRGKAVLKIELTEAGRKLFGPLTGEIDIQYQNGPVVEPANLKNLTDYEVLAVFRTEIAENGTPAGIQIGAPALLIAPYGQGKVLISSPHPELTPPLNDWVRAAVRQVARHTIEEKN